jgi:transglycosylase-like protein with SLT domain
MRTEKLRPVIDAMAAWCALPSWEHQGDLYLAGEWLEGLILQESGGDPRATRYEGHQDTVPDGDQPGADDGLFEDDKSYGLMQVMGSGARVLCGVPPGTRMEFSFLLLPLTNISFGLRILTGNLAETIGHIPSALARYNGGSYRNPVGGDVLRNQSYVDLVAAQAARVQLARAAAGRPWK